MKIDYSKKFEKMYRKLDVRIREKVKQRIKVFSESPCHPLLNNHSVDPPYPNTRSINITGNYRALFIFVTETRILFTHIGTHSELYE